MRRPLLALCLAALASAFSGSCAEGQPLLGDDCVPNQRVFCRCSDGSGGTQLCARDGKSFGECGPCPTGAGDDDDLVSRPVCGNGRVEQGEQCDDGNAADGDECSSLCQRAQATGPGPGDGADDCQGAQPGELNVGVEFQVRQALAAASAGARGSCGGEGAELVFGLTPNIGGRLELTLTPDDPELDAVIYVRRAACDDDQSEPDDGCQNAEGAGGEERLSVAVDADTPYFVFVDAENAEMGAALFTLTARVNPSEACQGEGDSCDTGLPGACSEGTLRCTNDQFLVCQADQTSADEECGDGRDNDCDGDIDEGCDCAHDKCQAGAPLAPGCTRGGEADACVQAVCDADPFCCGTPNGNDPPTWDAICVNQVYFVCGELSCSAHRGQCAHSVCQTGGILQADCDGAIDCVEKVCDADPFCCGTPNQSGPAPNWDKPCVDGASTLCAINGKPDACDF
jgi:cysteine-rich repeat protein